MRRYGFSVPGFLAAFSLFCGCASALAAAPAFTIAATDVTLTSSGATGSGSSSVTLTSVGGYTGSVQVVCDPPTPQAGVKVPYCNGPAADPVYTLTANQAVTGKVTFFNTPLPVVRLNQPRRPISSKAPVLALAGMFLWGFAARRRAKCFLSLVLVAAGTLACLSGMSACGGSDHAVTPGTYLYTFTATDTHTAKSETASIHVTVP